MTEQAVFTKYKNALVSLLEKFDAVQIMRDQDISFDNVPYHLRDVLLDETGVFADIVFVGCYPSPNSSDYFRDIFAFAFKGNVIYLGFDYNGCWDYDSEVYLLTSYTQEDFKKAADKAKEDAFKSDLLLVCVNNTFALQ